MTKFRMWVPEKQKMLPVISLYWTEDHESLDTVGMSIFENEPWDEDWIRDLYPEDVRIMESTGYYDANDTEIYEGDILMVSPKVDSTNSGIKGLREDCPLVVESIQEWYRFWYVNYYHFFAFIPAHLLEIVGNIYENPELLEKENRYYAEPEGMENYTSDHEEEDDSKITGRDWKPNRDEQNFKEGLDNYLTRSDWD